MIRVETNHQSWLVSHYFTVIDHAIQIALLRCSAVCTAGKHYSRKKFKMYLNLKQNNIVTKFQILYKSKDVAIKLQLKGFTKSYHH